MGWRWRLEPDQRCLEHTPWNSAGGWYGAILPIQNFPSLLCLSREQYQFVSRLWRHAVPTIKTWPTATNGWVWADIVVDKPESYLREMRIKLLCSNITSLFHRLSMGEGTNSWVKQWLPRQLAVVFSHRSMAAWLHWSSLREQSPHGQGCVHTIGQLSHTRTILLHIQESHHTVREPSIV